MLGIALSFNTGATLANYENSHDLKKEVLFACGELEDGTSEYDDKVMVFLNRANQAMLSGGADLGLDIGQPWSWAKKQYPSTIIIQPDNIDYTFDVVNGSNIITFTSTPIGSFLNYFITFNDDKTVYRIKSHISGAMTALLDSVYIEDSASGASSHLMKYDYVLDSGILRLIGPFLTTSNHQLGWTGNIEMIDQVTFGREFPVSIRQGLPDRFTQVYKTNDMQPTVRFNRIPAPQDKPIKIQYDYIPVPDDLIDDVNSIPVIPREHRITLVYYASYYLMMDKNDTRAAEYRELTRAGMLAIVRSLKLEKANTNQNYGRFISRSDNYGCWWNRRNYRGYY